MKKRLLGLLVASAVPFVAGKAHASAFALAEQGVPNAQDRSVRLPDNDRYWLSLGATYRMSQASRLDFGYSYIMVKDADIANNQIALGRGSVVGKYEANVNVFSVSYQHSF